MSNILNISENTMIANIDIASAEREMLEMPQAQCEVTHYFGPGICIREVRIPAGTFAIGHHQNHEHLNYFIKGRVVMINEDGDMQEIAAPMIFTGQPGRKVGYILEDMVWQNIYPTTETDVGKIEEHYITKSETWIASNEARAALDSVMRQVDRDDYVLMLQQVGIPHEVAMVQSENKDDQITLTLGNVRVAQSPIEGMGLFATSTIKQGEVIAPARIDGKRTQAGRYTNHSAMPNAQMVMMDSGDVNLVALSDMAGCLGGDSGEEITIDYRQALILSGRIICQQ